jgi:alkyldihydroxyacetonephosphate synthase
MHTEWVPGRWGGTQPPVTVDSRTRSFAQEHLGPPVPAPPPTVPAVQASRLGDPTCRSLFPDVVASTDDLERARASRGMSYLDFLQWRTSAPNAAPMPAPDVVLFPDSHEQVLRVLDVCSREEIAVVPVGGGTSVTGALTLADSRRDDSALAIAMSTTRLDRIIDVDDISGIAHVECGVTGPQLEAHLTDWTLGHFPQSWERASIGGFIAARSSGQSSSGYGRIEDMLLGAQVATPVGTWDVGGFPAASIGPDLRHLILGSEGTLGVVTSARLRLRRRPSVRQFAAAVLPGDFERAASALRALAQSPLRPTVMRASDAAETAAMLTMSLPSGVLGSAVGAYLRMRSALPGSLIVLGWEGTGESDVAAARARSRDVLNEAIWLGGRPGRAWERSRFHGPYLRDALMDEGYLVETFETVTTWSNIAPLHERVREAALEVLGERCYVMAHISHTYDTGASLYFTVLAGGWHDPEVAARRWREAKATITDAIVDGSGALSHHHGIGRDHRRWLPAQIGDTGMDVLASIKATVDPNGVMNPGALL